MESKSSKLKVPKLEKNRKFFVRFRGNSRGARVANFSIYAGIFVVLVVLLFSGYRAKNADSRAENSSATTVAAQNGDNLTLPTVTSEDAQSASIATRTALATNLSSLSSIANTSYSYNNVVSLNQSDATAAEKPQIANPTATAQPIMNYTAAQGDTAATIAAKFGVSDQTVRWANNLTNDNISAGANLQIPAVDGVVYEVKSGDKLVDVVAKYKSNLTDVLALNNLTDENVAAGAKILIPDGDLPETERPGYVAPRPVVSTNVNYSYSSSSGGGIVMTGAGYGLDPQFGYGGFYFGQCTRYAYNRRGQLGLRQPSWRGDAGQWMAGASRAGWNVSRTPSVGAIFQEMGYPGHVGIVENVYADGSILISEMNYVGNNVTNTRQMTPAQYQNNWFLQ